jgi:hypothetical protein
MDMLTRFEKLAETLKAGGTSDADTASFIRRVINSPLTALVVKATPTPVDDAVLAILKTMFPAA